MPLWRATTAAIAAAARPDREAEVEARFRAAQDALREGRGHAAPRGAGRRALPPTPGLAEALAA